MLSNKLNQLQSRLNKSRRAGYFAPLRIAMFYAIFATLWIIFSDQLIERFTRDPQFLSRLQTYKGLLFVTITTILVWLMTQRPLLSQNKLIAALHDSQSRLCLFFDNVSCGILECDLQGQITFCNQAHHAILGVKPNELIGSHIWDYNQMKPLNSNLNDCSIIWLSISYHQIYWFPTILASKVSKKFWNIAGTIFRRAGEFNGVNSCYL